MFLGPWSEMHRLNLGWFIAEWNKFYAEWQSTLQAITGALTGEIERVEAAMTELYAARDAAAASATAANSSALNASASSLAAMDARDTAVSARNAAQSAANGAAQSALSATDSATLASNKASQASTSATQAANSAGAAQQSETDAATEALKSEGYAVGKQNGTNVTSGSPYYHNNSKYYAESIAGDAAEAAASAAAAAGSATDAATSAAAVAGVSDFVNNAMPSIFCANKYFGKTTIGKIVINGSHVTINDGAEQRYSITGNPSTGWPGSANYTIPVKTGAILVIKHMLTGDGTIGLATKSANTSSKTRQIGGYGITTHALQIDNENAGIAINIPTGITGEIQFDITYDSTLLLTMQREESRDEAEAKDDNER